MQKFSFDFFIITSFLLLLWGMLKPERVLQYPFFMGGIFVAFLVPQAIVIIRYPGPAPITSIYRILLYGALCAVMCVIGYSFNVKEEWLASIDGVVNPHKLLKVGFILAIFGTLCQLILGNIEIETRYGGWTGPATILAFLSGTIWFGFSIFLLHGLYWRRFYSIVLATLTFLVISPSIFDLGRRQITATTVIILGLALFFTRRILPPRWLVLVLILSTTFLIPVVGQMRGGFWGELFTGNLSFEDVRRPFERLQEGKTLELRNAALMAEQAVLTGRYGYGTGIWNSIVFQYVPAQWFGREFKESFYIRLVQPDFQNLFNYKRPTGTTFTGLGDSFQEFSYLGCLLFALIAYLFKYLWISSVYRNSIYAQILYMSLVSSALLAVTHGIGRFTNEAIFRLIMISIIIQFSRHKPVLHSSEQCCSSITAASQQASQSEDNNSY